MRIRIFRAPTLSEAIAQIRSELGTEALILSDRRNEEWVEVTAALETSDAPVLRSLQSAETLHDLEPFTSPQTHGRTLQTGSIRREDPDFRSMLAWHGLSSSLISVLSEDSVEAACGRVFQFARLQVSRGDDPLLLAGPPGGGKTLSTARLATRLVLAGEHPMVITTDGRRAGAVEQLAAFTRLLGLTMVAAETPATLSQALAQRNRGQPVLIDAPSLDLENPAQLRTLEELRDASTATLCLVLPCGLDPGEAQEIACAHADAGARSLIATRADHSRRLGGILCASSVSGLALTEAGIGSGVADGLTPITPRFLAERLQRANSAARGSPRTRDHPRPSPERITRSALPLHIAAQKRAASNL